jgi:transposase-like protein
MNNYKRHRFSPESSEVVDVYLQAKRDGAAAKRLFKRLARIWVGT